jgi:hypothetical protein
MCAAEYSTEAYEITGDVSEMEHPFTHFKVPMRQMVMFQEVRYKDWEMTLEGCDFVKHGRHQVQVVMHVRILEDPNGTPANNMRQFLSFVKDDKVSSHIHAPHLHTRPQREKVYVISTRLLKLIPDEDIVPGPHWEV